MLPFSSTGVIQGFFPRGVSHGARFAAPVQAKCATPGCGQGRVVHSPAHARSIQRHAASNAAAFQLPETMTKFTEIGGQPLPPNVRQKMESFFGASFADVRVHVGPQAAAIGALAFTQGSHIHFAPGQYNLASPQGQQVLGHELAHVVQQRAGRVRNPFGAGVAVVQDRGLEIEADRLGARAAAHHVAQPMMATAARTVQLRPPKRGAANRQWGTRSRYGRLQTLALTMPAHIKGMGNRLRQEYMRAEGHDSQGGNYVYLATTEGEASYVGITDNPAARQHEHGLRHHLHVLNRNSPMTRIEVRAIEQSYIHAARRNPRNQNIANSIAAHHPYYGAAMRFGRAFLGWIRREFPRTRLRFEI